MKNLASLVTEKSLLAALEFIDKTSPKLNAARGYYLHHQNKTYPPKEVVRIAARLQGISQLDGYRLQGGHSTNKHLQKLGFDVTPFRTLSRSATPQVKEKRMARICWNDNGWVGPSGRLGKSSDKNSHEGAYGYGHEEWLFDMGKLIDGFHYGFLEPVRKQQQAYKNKPFDVWLYTIDGVTKKRYWIGEIKDLIALDEEEAAAVKAHYVANGWLAEMETQIRSSGANQKGFSNYKGVDLFNVKFRVADVAFADYRELVARHPVEKLSRYSFNRYDDGYAATVGPYQSGFTFLPPIQRKIVAATPATKTILRQPKAVEITNLHQVVSDGLERHLQSVYGFNNVRAEHPIGSGQHRVDMVVNDSGRMIFYEIKTYASLQTSIREALGQILEYAYWTSANNANELIIVTQPHQDYSEVAAYFQHLRNVLGIEIYYQAFDLDTPVLLNKL